MKQFAACKLSSLVYSSPTEFICLKTVFAKNKIQIRLKHVMVYCEDMKIGKSYFHARDFKVNMTCLNETTEVTLWHA